MCELREPVIGCPDGCAAAGDVSEKFLSGLSATERAEPLEFAFGVVECAFCLLPRFRGCEPLLFEQAEPGAEFGGGFELFDFCAGVVERSGGERLLVEGEPFDR